MRYLCLLLIVCIPLVLIVVTLVEMFHRLNLEGLTS